MELKEKEDNVIDLTKKTIKTILLIDKSKNMHKLCKITDTTYSYQIRLLKLLEVDGFITTEKIGRDRHIKLTEKGKELKWHVEKISLL